MLSSLKPVLKEIQKELAQKEDLRKVAQEKMRKITSLSKQAILRSHMKRHKEAKEEIAKAKQLVTELQKQAEESPSIIYGGMFSEALQEYSEANILVTLIAEARFITPQELNVPPVDYVLGLADVIGEYRRLALDALREGDVERGEQCLQTMDEIHIELLALDEEYMLVPGLRRKSDVARRIIEATRGDITQEVRRKSLEDYLQRFEEHQKKKTKAET